LLRITAGRFAAAAPASDALCGLQLIINHLKNQFQNLESQSRQSLEKTAKSSAVLN